MMGSIDENFYVNVAELMGCLPRPKPREDLPIIEVTTGLWSPITWQ